mmetsp:Transcript_69819/g.161517  ORF Transcript_69819/g.161517 Transcript_69819/m.161517 type:complete len:230 (+) Transcript_69819:50-739(+)
MGRSRRSHVLLFHGGLLPFFHALSVGSGGFVSSRRGASTRWRASTARSAPSSRRTRRTWAQAARCEDLTTIVTEVELSSVTPSEALGLVSTASYWPSIVLSSWSVEGQTSLPLARGDTVKECFGVPPLWSPSVEWTCELSDLRSGIVDIRSLLGASGLADNCRMLFTAEQSESGGTKLCLEMSYRSLGLLAWLAQPLLELDNAIALRVLLPLALCRRPGLAHQGPCKPN